MHGPCRETFAIRLKKKQFPYKESRSLITDDSLVTFSLPLAKQAVRLPSSQCQHFHVEAAVVAAVVAVPVVVVVKVDEDVKKYLSISSKVVKS